MIKVFLEFYKIFPLRISLLCVLLFMVNTLEAIGLGLIIPVFQGLMPNQVMSESRLSSFFEKFFQAINLDPTLENTLILLCASFLLRGMMTLMGRRFSLKIACDFQSQVKLEAYEAILQSKLGFLRNQRAGSLANMLTMEALRASAAFFLAAQWVAAFFSAILYLSFAIVISGWLALIAGISGVFVLTPLKKIARRAIRFGNITTELNEKIQNELIEIFSAIKVVKGSAFEQHALQRFSLQNRDYIANWYQMAFNSNLIPICTQPIGILILSMLLYISVRLQLPLAEIMLFQVAFIRLIPTVSQLHALRNDLNNNLPGFERVRSIVDNAQAAAERKGGNFSPSMNKGLEFQGVSFGYVQNVPILRDISFRVPVNQSLGLIGASGAGKSTIIDLILGFYSPENGRIMVDSIDLNSLDLYSWRGKLAYVTQDIILFHDTVKANICWGKEDVFSMDQVVEAARAVDAHEFILSLEHGYDTVIGDWGGKLSGGQKQRLALARALLRKPKFLILDEATSSLDQQSELAIKKTLVKLQEKQDMTIIMVAHRLTTIEHCDRVIWLEDGRIKKVGPPKEIIPIYSAEMGAMRNEEDSTLPNSINSR